ncbi:hypothetical protein H9L39_18423 [Fusarium oxysporum f. sp. albedinis]|nr:hypothetical protein H9L39_18423 [Fusarium oxysporum f. sp. albedinis]
MNLADSLWLIGCRKEALQMAQQVLTIREKTMRQSDLRLVRTKRKVAEYLHGTFERRKALVMREKLREDSKPSEYNPTSVEYLDWLSTSSALADSYQWDGQLINARILRWAVFEGRFKSLGCCNCDTILAYERLLSVDFRLVQTTKAHQELCQRRWRLVQTCEALLGAEHPYALEARVNLGHSYSATGQWDNALREQERVLNIRERLANERKTVSLDLSWLSSMGNVANILIKTGNFKRALAFRKRALSFAVQLYGFNHPTTFRMTHHVISCYSGPDSNVKPRTVIKMRENVLSRQKRHLGEDDPLVLLAMSLLASDYERDYQKQRSTRLRWELLPKQGFILGRRNPDTLNNMKKLARTLQSGGRPQKAAELMEQVLAAEIDFLGSNNAQAHNTRIELYRIYRKMGDDSKAKAMAKDIRKIECDYSICNEDSLIDYKLWEGDDEADDAEKAFKQTQRKDKLDRLAGDSQGSRKRQRTGRANIIESGCLVRKDTSRYEPQTLEEVFPAIELDNQDELGLAFPVIPRRVLANEELYPSSSEKFGGESGSEASDSSYGF